MEQITVGQIAVAIAFLVTLISGLGVLLTKIKKWIQNAMKEPLDGIKTEIKDMSKRIDEVDMESCKNFLVRFLSDVEKGEKIDEIEKERFFEQYQHYIKKGGNSYIRHKVDKLQGQGKL